MSVLPRLSLGRRAYEARNRVALRCGRRGHGRRQALARGLQDGCQRVEQCTHRLPGGGLEAMTIRSMNSYNTCSAQTWMQQTVAPCLLALLTAACGSAYEPRKDEIECALPDGSSFILRSTYLGLKPVHRHPTNIWVGGARSVNRSGFETYYRPAKDGRDLHAAGGHSWGLILSKYNDLNYMTRLCALHGMINGVPY